MQVFRSEEGKYMKKREGWTEPEREREREKTGWGLVGVKRLQYLCLRVDASSHIKR